MTKPAKMFLLLKARHHLDFFNQPTPAQAQAGNYPKRKFDFQGLPISIENECGSVREGRSEDGKAWQTSMQCHYGYIRGTVGADGDHFDVFIGPDAKSSRVWVIQTMSPPDFRKKDEEKAMLGFNSEKEARDTYLAHYDDTRFLGSIREMSIDTFRRQVLATKQNNGQLREPEVVRKAFIMLSRTLSP
ncbi:MAG: hypothetical protein ABF876_05185 [Acetobacter aceti]